MNNFLQFDDYDLLAYVGTGVAVVFVCDTLFATHVLKSSMSVLDGVGIVFGAYILGHITQAMASATIERRLLYKWPGRPLMVLTCGYRGPAFLKATLFSEYGREDRFLAPLFTRIAADKRETAAEALYRKGQFEAKKSDIIYRRIDVFVRQYQLCKNLSFVALAGGVLALVLWIAHAVAAAGWMPAPAWLPAPHDPLLWTGVFLAVGVAMFERYIKFYRHFTQEVLSALDAETVLATLAPFMRKRDETDAASAPPLGDLLAAALEGLLGRRPR